jgi:hypothetical protein
MEDKNKHNIFSKEEFFKAIDEKRSLGADADDFDKEALEGLTMVKDRQKLGKLDADIDEIVRRESSKAGRKKNIYYFAAAASLALIIGIFFLVKENSFKEDKNLAQSAPEKTEEVVTGKDQPVEEEQKAITQEVDKKAPSKEAIELKGKEEAFKEGKLAESSGDNDAFRRVVTAVPTESANRAAANEKANDKRWAKGEGMPIGGNMQDSKSEGKSVDQLGVSDQEKYRGLSSGSYNKPDEKKVASKKTEEFSKNLEDETTAYKDTDEKGKKHYESNTVWITSPSAVGPGVAKQQQAQTESKPKTTVDDRTVTGSTTTAANSIPVQSQVAQADLSKADKNNNAEVAASGEEQVKTEAAESRKNRNKSGGKHSKSKSAAYEPAPSREENKDAAGYSFYSQTSTRDFSSPEFIGGLPALQQFIGDNLEVSMPEKKGTLTVEFTVKPDGTVDTSNVKVTQPIKGCEPCSKDVKDLVKKMPKWQPALENGKGKEYRQKMSVLYKSRSTKK